VKTGTFLFIRSVARTGRMIPVFRVLDKVIQGLLRLAAGAR
jgi:hypothetical protein